MMLRIAMAMLFVVLVALEADARPRRRSSGSSSSSSQVVYSGGPQSVASSKAQRAASTGRKGHVGGGFGGGSAEGVGFSTHSAQAALNSCCFTGKRKVAGSSVVRGSDGWYACKIYY